MTDDRPALAREHAARFARRFGRPPALVAAAPGRVNLIGEHTDYNDGFVLPMAIDRLTLAAAAPREDGRFEVASTAEAFSDVSFTVEHEAGAVEPWARYVLGVVAECAGRGVRVDGGADLMIHATVPAGGGLSSSASLEVSVATVLAGLAGVELDPVERALWCQAAEHRYAGVPCGIMDQFASSLAEAGHAMRLDCRSHERRMVPMADPSIRVLIAHTRVSHELAGGEYARRRQACEAAAEALGVKALRDADPAALEAARATMSGEAYRRARHVVTENARTLEAAEALGRGDWTRAGALMAASHLSLRDDFEVSCPELDVLAELALELGPAAGVYGARMTGGGFGGATVWLVRAEAVAQVREAIETRYRRRAGREAMVFPTTAAAGAELVSFGAAPESPR